MGSPVDEGMEARFGFLADVVLAGRGLNVDAITRSRLLKEVGWSSTDALEQAKVLRKAGDGTRRLMQNPCLPVTCSAR